MEETEVYLVNGERVNVTDWPQQYKILWLSNNLNAERVEAKEDEVRVDRSMFGKPDISVSTDTNAGYKDFDLTSLIKDLYRDDVQQFDEKYPAVPESPQGITAVGDWLVEGLTIPDPENTEYSKILGLQHEDYKNKPEVKSAIINAAINPIDIDKPGRTGVPGEIMYEGLGLSDDSKNEYELEMYSQQDVSRFMKQPSIQKALELGFINKKDLALGMYPGYTAWVETMGDQISDDPSGIKLPDGRELTNREVYKIMWKNDMPYDSEVEKLKRRARNKVNKFVLQDAHQIETIIDLEKLNQPYIFEEYAVEDTFVNDVFNEEALSLDEDFNIKDFNGFLNNRGFKNNLQQKILELNKIDTEESRKAIELLKLDHINYYVNEQITRDLLQQKLMWEKANPGRDADTEGIQFSISEGNLDPKNIKKWMKRETPYVYNQLEENQLTIEKEYQNLLNTGGDVGTGEFLQKVSGNAWLGFWHDAIDPTIASILDFIPGEYTDEVAENMRRNTLIRRFEKGDNLRYAYKQGMKLKFPEYGNIEYLVAADGRIYDMTNKLEATAFLTPNQQADIIEKARSKGKKGASSSSLGLAFESSRVIGDLFFQIGLTWGVGKVRGGVSSKITAAQARIEKARRLEKAIGGYDKGMGVLGKTRSALRLMPIKPVIADAMIAQGTIGLVRGYEETLFAARDAGINEEQARELASNASLQTGVWYALTAPISPQTKAKNLIFNKIPKETSQTAINIFRKEGWKGWNNYWKNIKTNITTIDGLKEIGKSGLTTLDMMQREGWKELFQENIQQVGETTRIGAQTNMLAGQQIVKQDYTLEDFIHTSQISFIAGFLMPGGGKVLNSSRDFYRKYTGMDNVDRFNALTYMYFNKKSVEKILAKQVKDGNYTQEEVNNLLGEIDQFGQTTNHLPSDIDAKNAKTVLDALAELNRLEQEKKDKPNGLYGYEGKIKKLREKINNAYYDAVTGDQRAGIMAAAKAGVAGNTIFKALENEQEALDYLKTIIKRNKDQESFSDKEFDNYLKERFFSKAGGAMFIKDGTKHALEFKWKAAMAPRGSAAEQTASHEFKHALWVETIGDDVETQQLLGKALFLELGKMDLDLDNIMDDSIIPVKFQLRWQKYMKFLRSKIDIQKELLKWKEISKTEYERAEAEILGKIWEEGMMLYSEAVGQKWVSYDEDVADRLKNTWRRAMQFIGATDFEFDSGKAVFDMIRDYNAAVESGTLRWNRAFKKMGTKGAKVDKEKLKKELDNQELKDKITAKEEKRRAKRQELNTEARAMLDKMRKRQAKSETVEKKGARTKQKDDDRIVDDKFSLLPSRETPEVFKERINTYYDKDKWITDQGIESVLYDIILEYEPIIESKIYNKYQNLPNVNVSMLTSDTMTELLSHIRNFNKQFLKERQKYKDSLEQQGLSKTEIKKRLEIQDEQGYKITTGKKKGEIVKENPDLNAWINAQLNNKIKSALKKPGRTTPKFDKQLDENITQVEDKSTAKEQALQFEKEQDQLAYLLDDPLFGFVNQEGEEIIIQVVPFGGGETWINDVNDPAAAVNIRLATETDPNIIEDLERQKRNLKRGLELEAKGVSNLTKDEFKELKDLKGFEAFQIGPQKTVKTFEALTLPQSAASIIVAEVQKMILRSPNIETLEFRNFKEKFSNYIFPLARKMTFKNKEDIQFFMYDNWKIIYDVINNPYDPVTGKSTYAVKKMPPILKAFDEDGNRIKKKDINRAVFLQAFFGRDEAEKIIRKYNKRPNKELKQLLPPERHPAGHKFAGQLVGTKADGRISYAFFDRRTSLMELFGDVIVLQEARKALRNELFIKKIAEVNPPLAAELNNEKIKSEIINDLATGKTTSVKFSLNDDLSGFMKGRSIEQQLVIADMFAKAGENIIIKSKDQEVKNSILFEVPNLEDLNDKAKSFYIISKMAEGYNNFKFINKNNEKGKTTKAVLEVGDVKFSPDFDFETYSNDLGKGFNEILAETADQADNMTPEKIVERAEATAVGSDKSQWWHYGGMYNPGDADFESLLHMIASSRGKKGEQQMAWFEKHLLLEYDKGNYARRNAAAANIRNLTALRSKYKDKFKTLDNKIVFKDGSTLEGFVEDDAYRVYMWSSGPASWAPGVTKIPGLSSQQKRRLQEWVLEDVSRIKFAGELSKLSKQPNGWIEPYDQWKGSNIVIEITQRMIDESRKKYLSKFLQNADLIFTEKNLNKLELIWGKSMRDAIENALYTMRYGRQEKRADKPMSALMNYLNNSIGVTMFTNMRSATLQVISMLNFINMSDNSIIHQSQAMANFPEYIRTFRKLFASGYLVDRRQGMLTNLQEQEIMRLADSTKYNNLFDWFNAWNAYILKVGFLPTRVMDSFAIAFGGAGFVMNRTKTYMKDGFEKKEAEEKAMFDWYRQAERTQQSGDPSRISLHQASDLGRLMMAFQNTPLQYGRVVKRAAVDLAKGRGNPMENISRIAYYGGVSFAIFAFIQNALMASLFGWDEEEEYFNPKKYDTQWERFYTAFTDNALKMMGAFGNVLAWAIRVEQKRSQLMSDPKAVYKEADYLLVLSSIIVPANIKLRTAVKGFREEAWNKKDIKYDKWVKGNIKGRLENPHWIKSQLYTIEAATSFPAARLVQKWENLDNMMNMELENYQRLMLFLGWNTWNLGLENVQNNRRGRTDELDFGPGIKFDGLKFAPDVKF